MGLSLRTLFAAVLAALWLHAAPAQAAAGAAAAASSEPGAQSAEESDKTSKWAFAGGGSKATKDDAQKIISAVEEMTQGLCKGPNAAKHPLCMDLSEPADNGATEVTV
mmetsp:Transcript_17259/g.39057  ORF Transcript_17259/g.39057 Transcript_17259/m.39057 type:complete len:108 (+) Transcript_17259:73-396(+)